MIAKCPCEHCGGNIEFATEEFLSGSDVTCPHCGKETPLYVSPQAKPAPKPAAPATIVKCNCHHCSTHLEFNSANAGQVITCPTCGKETTLYIPTPPPTPAPKAGTPATPPPKKSKLGRLALKTVLIFMAFFVVLAVIINLIGEPDPFSEDNHPAKFSGVYLLDFSGAGTLSVDLRSDGSGLFCGSASTWFLDGETIKLRTHDGRTREYKAEGNDLIDGGGNRWIRAR